VNLINCIHDDTKVELSKPTETANEAAFKALERAAGDLKRGAIDALVTAPAGNYPAAAKYPPHTEYLENTFGSGKKALTVFVYEELRIALVTGDIPFPEVLPQITKERIVEKLSIFYHSLKQDFNIVKPRIGVLSLNPEGTAGKEEEQILIPAIQEAEKQGILSFGPYAADSFFGGGAQTYDKFDGILAMYYDQGIVPFKTLVADRGIQYTAGLPIVRTAPVHGTAHEIAGQNLASEDSFRQAVYAALDICRNRLIYKEANRNPLRKQYFEKGAADESLDLTKEEADHL
jgi:4-hydroxythreonine-4-phosphate dehydrogenase